MANFTTTGSDTFPAGHILQTSYVKMTSGSAGTTTSTYQDYPQLTLTMTPADSDSKFYISANPHVYMDNHNNDDY